MQEVEGREAEVAPNYWAANPTRARRLECKSRGTYTFLSRWVCMRADPGGKLGDFTQLPAKVGRDFSLVQS